MKVILLMPPTDPERSYGGMTKFSNPVPSIGLAYIAALLRHNGYAVSILDAYCMQISVDEVVERVVHAKPDILGVSVLTTSAFVVEQIALKIKKLLPEISIVMGNLHASLFADELLQKEITDIVVHREGEHTMLEVADALKAGTSLDKVKGISYCVNGEVRHNEMRSFITELDALPLPAWDLFDLKLYSRDPRSAVKGMAVAFTELYLLATRGCPSACTFCSSHTEKSMGVKYRMRSPEKVVDEISLLYDKYGATVISFMDLAFPLVRSHAMDLCQEIIRRNLNKKIRWISEVRANSLDEELLHTMKKAGCIRLYLGIESGNQEILDAIKKKITLEDVRRAVDMSRKEGIEIDATFMLGLPGETREMSWKTVKFAKQLDVRFAIFNLFVPYPGCALYDQLKAQGKISAESWSDFASYPSYSGSKPVYVPDGRDWRELVQTQKRAMREFYLRPKFIIGELKRFRFSHLRSYFAGLKSLIMPSRNTFRNIIRK